MAPRVAAVLALALACCPAANSLLLESSFDHDTVRRHAHGAELNRQILEEEADKATLQKELSVLTERLQNVNQNLAQNLHEYNNTRQDWAALNLRKQAAMWITDCPVKEACALSAAAIEKLANKIEETYRGVLDRTDEARFLDMALEDMSGTAELTFDHFALNNLSYEEFWESLPKDGLEGFGPLSRTNRKASGVLSTAAEPTVAILSNSGREPDMLKLALELVDANQDNSLDRVEVLAYMYLCNELCSTTSPRMYNPMLCWMGSNSSCEKVDDADIRRALRLAPK